jgi:polyphenol oxidase
VHGAAVVEVTEPGEHAGAEADAAVSAATGAVLAVQTADCAPLALVADGGAIGVVHAGWRGLLDGVVERAVGRLRGLAPGPYRALLGPCIGPECYEFGIEDLEAMVQRFGPEVRSATREGRPALDLRVAAAAALAELETTLETRLDDRSVACTACGGRWFSHRARGETERQALVAWIEAEP